MPDIIWIGPSTLMVAMFFSIWLPGQGVICYAFLAAHTLDWTTWGAETLILLLCTFVYNIFKGVTK